MKEEILKGYKVVRVFKKKYYSASNMKEVRYKKKRWAKPHKGDGPLCVFDRLESSVNFCNCPNTLVFECEFVKSENQNEIWFFVKKMKNSSRATYPGTVLADIVKIVSEIE
jgi:hypothetical protein